MALREEEHPRGWISYRLRSENEEFKRFYSRSVSSDMQQVVGLKKNGKLVNPRPSTLAKFDVGLRWKPGSAAEVFWQGGSPTTLA